MKPLRPTYWNIPLWAEVLVYVLGFLAVIIFAFGVYIRIKKWRFGKSEVMTGSVLERSIGLLVNTFFQRRLSSDLYTIVMHLAIFWGMVFLLIGTILATVDWDVTHLFFGFQFLVGDFYLIYELILDISGFLVIFGIGMAIYRRYFLRLERLKTPQVPTFRWDSVYLLLILLLINLSGYAIQGLRIAGQNPSWISQVPIGYFLSKVFYDLPFSTISSLHFLFWSFHLLLALIFIASIPYSKSFHIISSPLSIYFRNLSSKGELPIGKESGVCNLGDFSWRKLLQMDACTWCGRCQDVCPAYKNGLLLSPKNFVLKLDTQLQKSGKNNELINLHGSIISDSELWACTTCKACEQTCPVFIEQSAMIVELRRYLVNQGDVELTIQDFLQKVQRYGNSFGQSERNRAKWTIGIEPKIKDARKEETEYLLFTGDYAAFDPRVINITKTTAMIFQKAGLDFGILYDSERNAGNDVRRIGEEGLFEILRDKNLQAFSKSKFKKIVAIDPHTYNTLKNEYNLENTGNGNGTPVKVLHYTEVIEELINNNKLAITNKLELNVTYHDPCYLGRYNGIYEPPRNILKAIGTKLIEMPRNRSKSYCCGAGGGRIWMEDKTAVTERSAENRIKEAAGLDNVNTFVVACPKDIVMFQDAVKTSGYEQKIIVKDISELVYESIDNNK